MRIVAGNYGGRPLKTLDGKITRPTTDKVRGAMFNMIGPFFEGGRVLDLYAGSGALSIEAVSRGMDEAVLVEKNRKAQAVVTANIQMTKESQKFHLMKMSAEQALTKLDRPFDLVFLDPPYAKEKIVETIETLQTAGLLSDETIIVCETDKKVDLPETIENMLLWKQKSYGISKVTVYRAAR